MDKKVKKTHNSYESYKVYLKILGADDIN